MKSTSIIGGSQGLNYVVSLVRNKIVAVLLGTAGVGLIGLYQSAVTLVGALTNLGIARSGVREVAVAQEEKDQRRIASTIVTLRRACWVTGVLGWLVTAAFAWPLSQWTFGSPEKSGAIALLGVTLLLVAITGGQSALVQGMRRIGDLARISIVNALGGTLLALLGYGLLGEEGIVPVLIGSAALNLGIAWWFARRISVEEHAISWRESLRQCRGLLTLGLAFMWGSLLTALVALATRSFIIRELGLDENGIYQAAWAISGMFAGFILNAMGADFYPHLTSVVKDHSRANQLVNEQIEIGLLLAVPGIIGTLIFAPLMMRIFYSAAFISGAELLPWFVLGILARVVSWPLGFLILAKGATRWYFFGQTQFNVILISLVWYLIPLHGLKGAAIAFALTFIPAGITNIAITYKLTGFHWSRNVVRLVAISFMFVALGFACSHWVPGIWKFVVGGLLTAIAGFLNLRGISSRLGPEHRIVRKISRLPFGKLLCGI